MKILYLSNARLPSEISHSLSIMRMCQAFTDEGHDVLLTGIAGKTDADPVSYYGLRGGFRVICDRFPRWIYNDLMRKSLIGGLLHALKTRRLFREFRPDLVY